MRWRRQGAFSREIGLSQGLDSDLCGRTPGVVGRNSGEGKAVWGGGAGAQGSRDWSAMSPQNAGRADLPLQSVQSNVMRAVC